MKVKRVPATFIEVLGGIHGVKGLDSWIFFVYNYLI